MKCPNCGYFNLPGATVCGQCRRAFDEAASSSSTSAQPEYIPVSEIMPPRAKNRSLRMQVEAHSPTSRAAQRFAVREWQQTRDDALNARVELWNWNLAMRWWLPPMLSLVPGLGQCAQKRFLSGAIFFCSVTLSASLGVLALHHWLSNILFFVALIMIGRGVFDAAHHSFPPATPGAVHWRALRLGLLSTLLVASTVLAAIGVLNVRYALWNMAGDQAAPLFQRGDGLVVERFRTDAPLLEIKRGDIIIADSDGPIIERVLGLPGDRVSYHNKALRVNGKVLAPPQMPLGFNPAQAPRGYQVNRLDFETKVPPGQVLLWATVMGNIEEMNEYGMNAHSYFLVNEDVIQGHVIGLFNPPSRRRWLSQRSTS
jgi:signal peptidase I